MSQLGHNLQLIRIFLQISLEFRLNSVITSYTFSRALSFLRVWVRFAPYLLIDILNCSRSIIYFGLIIHTSCSSFIKFYFSRFIENFTLFLEYFVLFCWQTFVSHHQMVSMIYICSFPHYIKGISFWLNSKVAINLLKVKWWQKIDINKRFLTFFLFCAVFFQELCTLSLCKLLKFFCSLLLLTNCTIEKEKMFWFSNT